MMIIHITRTNWDILWRLEFILNVTKCSKPGESTGSVRSLSGWLQAALVTCYNAADINCWQHCFYRLGQLWPSAASIQFPCIFQILRCNIHAQLWLWMSRLQETWLTKQATAEAKHKSITIYIRIWILLTDMWYMGIVGPFTITKLPKNSKTWFCPANPCYISSHQNMMIVCYEFSNSTRIFLEQCNAQCSWSECLV